MTVVVVAATAASGAIRVIQPDPAKDVVRVRLTVTSRAASVKVTTEGATITNTSVEDVSGGIGERPVIEGGSVGYTGNVPPFEVDVSIRLTLARVRGSRVSFRVERGGPGGVTLEVANLNDESQPEILDRFSTNDDEATFATETARLRARGPLSIGSVTPRLVLAHYYPWFDRSSWSSPLLADKPQQEYSTDEPSDVRRVFETAKKAGLDGLVVSWQGLDFGGGWNHRRMRSRSTPHATRDCASPRCSRRRSRTPSTSRTACRLIATVRAWLKTSSA